MGLWLGSRLNGHCPNSRLPLQVWLKRLVGASALIRCDVIDLLFSRGPTLLKALNPESRGLFIWHVEYWTMWTTGLYSLQ